VFVFTVLFVCFFPPTITGKKSLRFFVFVFFFFNFVLVPFDWFCNYMVQSKSGKYSTNLKQCDSCYKVIIGMLHTVSGRAVRTLS